MFNGDYSKHNYWPDAKKVYLSDKSINNEFTKLSNYLINDDMKKPKRYQYGGDGFNPGTNPYDDPTRNPYRDAPDPNINSMGDPVDPTGLSPFYHNPLLVGMASKADNSYNSFKPYLGDMATSFAGPKPQMMSRRDWRQAGKPGGKYGTYKDQFSTELGAYGKRYNSISTAIPQMFGSLSMLMQGFKGQQAYDNSQMNQLDLTETPGRVYQHGGDIDEMIEQDPWLEARGNIESNMKQDSVSSAGATGMFQITPIALKEYNRKYDSKYTWDQIKENPVANAHVSQGLINDIRSMISKVDSKLSNFDKNVLSEMAYNYGPYRFLDKLKSKGPNVTLEDMLNEKSLPSETRNHGRKFVEHFSKKPELPKTEYKQPPRDNTRVNQVKRFLGDPYEYKKEGTDYYYRKGGGDFKPINEADRKELQRRKFQFGGTLQNLLSNQEVYGKMLDASIDGKDKRKKRRLKGDILNSLFNNNLGNMFKYDISQVSLPPIFNTIKTEEEENIPINNPIPTAYSGDTPSSAPVSTPNVPVVRDDTAYRAAVNPQSLSPSVINTLDEKARGLRVPKGFYPTASSLRKEIKEVPREIMIRKAMEQIGRQFLSPDSNSGKIAQKYLVATEPDPSLLRSNTYRVYDTDGNQIGWQDETGQIIRKGLSPFPKFEGKLKPFNINKPDISKNQMGGNVNITGYFPGSPTENNPYNIIPSPNITMQGVNQNINAIPMNNGNPIGRPIRMRPGLNYYFPNADSVLEIPEKQNGGLIGRLRALTNNRSFANTLNDPLGLNRAQLNDVPIASRDNLREQLTAEDYQAPPQAPQPAKSTNAPSGFIMRKGESRWAYKDNNDGTYTVFDTQRGKGFTVGEGIGDQKAYEAVKNVFADNAPVEDFVRANFDPYRIQGVFNRYEPSASMQGPSMDTNSAPTGHAFNPTNAGYSQVNSTKVDTPMRNSVVADSPAPSRYTNSSLSNLPSSVSNPYQGSNIGATTIGQENFKDLKNLNHWSNKIPNSWNAAVQIAPALRLLGLGKSATINVIKDIFAKQAVKKKVGEAVSKKIASKANKAYYAGARYGPQYFQYGGDVEAQLIPIQTEKGERLYHLDGSISNVGAKKLHKNMMDDEVTDMVPEGTFVSSRDPNMKISRKEADKILLGNYAVKYEEGKPSMPPKNIKFGDLFKKKYHTPAELTDIIARRFPVSKKENDMFTNTANQENLLSRDMYMGVVKYMTEVKKPAAIDIYRYGGGVKKAQWGELIGGLFGLGSQLINNGRAKRATDASLRDIDAYQAQNMGNLTSMAGVNSLANIAGYATQDHTPEYADYTAPINEVTSGYSDALRTIPLRQQYNLNAGRAAANDAYSRLVNVDPRLAATAASSIGSNALKMGNENNMALSEYRDNLGINMGSQRAALLRESLLNRQATNTGVRSNRNQANAGLFGNFAQIGTDYYSGRNNIGNTALAARMGARGQFVNFMNSTTPMMANSFSQIGQGIGSLIGNLGKPSQIQSQWNDSSVNPASPNYNKSRFQFSDPLIPVSKKGAFG